MPKLPHISLPKFEHKVCYEWVLKKKHSISITHGHGHHEGCETVYPTGQGGIAPSGQAGIAPSGQGYAYTPTTYPAPQVFGAGQRAFQAARPAPSIASVPAELTQPTVGGEEAPPAPEVRGNSTIVPQNGGLLLPTGSGN